MNVKPGEDQPALRDKGWLPGSGIIQCILDTNGLARGIKKVLEEQGVNTSTLTGPRMRVILANNPDFANEKKYCTMLPSRQGSYVRFIPKFHYELNPIE